MSDSLQMFMTLHRAFHHLITPGAVGVRCAIFTDIGLRGGGLMSD